VPTADVLTATDNCGTAAVSYNETTTAGTCAGNYILTRTWTATDDCGLTTVHTQTITVEDTTAPTFVEALPRDMVFECNDVLPSRSEARSVGRGTTAVSYNETTKAGTCAGNYILTRTRTA